MQLYSQTVPTAPEPRVLAVHGRAGVLESHPGLATNYSNNLHHTTKIIAPVGDKSVPVGTLVQQFTVHDSDDDGIDIEFTTTDIISELR